MSRLLLLIIVSIVACSCSESDEPKPDPNKLSTIAGDYIYTVIDGNNQTGFPGQILETEIKITIRNLNGSPVSRPLQFELSDETGRIDARSYYAADTISINWKLGCNDVEQYIKVLDNLCGVAKSGCIDAEVFKISATASDEITSGWFAPCMSLEQYYYGYSPDLLINDNRIALFFGDDVVSIEDPIETNFKAINSSSSYYGSYTMLSNGEIFRSGSYPALTDWNNETWRNLTLPISSSNTYMEVSDNGYYFLVSEYRSEVYRSNNLTYWSQVIDINDYANYYGYQPQALISYGNYFYILVAGKYVLKIEASSGNVVTYEFPENSWSSYGDLDDIKAYVKNNKIFLRDSYNNDLEILDLNILEVTSYYVDSNSRLFKSDDEIYLMSGPNDIQKWNGTNFIRQEYPDFGSSDYYYDNYGIHKGSPVVVTSGGELYYHLN